MNIYIYIYINFYMIIFGPLPLYTIRGVYVRRQAGLSLLQCAPLPGEFLSVSDDVIYYSGVQLEENEMGGACGTYGTKRT